MDLHLAWESGMRIADAVPALISIVDRDYRFVRANECYRTWFGLHPEQVAGRHVREVMGQAAWSIAQPYMARALAGEAVTYEVYLPYEAVAPRWVRATYTPVRDPVSLGVIGFIAHVVDLTELKQVEEALRLSEERLLLFIENAPAAIAMFDREMRYLAVSRRWMNDYRLTGDIIGRSHYEIFPDIPAHWREAHRRGLAGETLHSNGDRFERGQGEVRWVKWDLLPWHTATGAVGGILIAAEDISERKQVEETLRASSLRERQRADEVQTLLDTLPIGVFVAHDPQGRMITGNRASEAYLRSPAGRNLSLSASADERPTNFRVFRGGVELSPDQLPVQRAARGERVEGEELEIVFDDGGRLNECISAAPLLDAEGRPRGAVAGVLNITDRKRAEAALREADRRKDEFLAMLAHELRNPLAPIRNAVALLRLAGPQDTVQDRARDIIERQVSHLVRLVDDLLDVSRVSRGKITLEAQALDLSAVVKQAIETSRPLIDARLHELTTSLPPLPVRVRGDFTRLTQVVSNLLNNAAKYTEEGGRISIAVEAAPAASGGPAAAVVRVRDNGRGIEARALSSVFDLFYQMDQTLDRADGGLGIGLSLVKSLVEMHGGQVDALSAGRGHGSEFVVRLPLLEEAPRQAEEEGAAAPRAGKARILVVDDNLDAAESMAMLLSLAGHEVLTAADGREAVAMALAERPDAIFMDIGLPHMDGYQACRAIRDAGLGATLIVAVSGYGQEEDRRRSQEAAFDAHLVKPVDEAVLHALLADLESGRIRSRPLPRR